MSDDAPITSRSGAPAVAGVGAPSSSPASRSLPLLFRVFNAITGSTSAPAQHHMPSDHRLVLASMANRAGKDGVYRWGVALLEADTARGASRIRECIRELVAKRWLVDLGLQGPANRAAHAYEVHAEGDAWEPATRRRETPTERRERLGLPHGGRPTPHGGPPSHGNPAFAPRQPGLPHGGNPGIAPREAGLPPHGDKPLSDPLADPLRDPLKEPGEVAHARDHAGDLVQGDQPRDRPAPVALRGSGPQIAIRFGPTAAATASPPPPPPPRPPAGAKNSKAPKPDVPIAALTADEAKVHAAIVGDESLAPIVKNPARLARDLVLLCPAIDIVSEVRALGAWLRLPGNRKSDGNAFLLRNLKRKQDEAPRRRGRREEQDEGDALLEEETRLLNEQLAEQLARGPQPRKPRPYEVPLPPPRPKSALELELEEVQERAMAKRRAALEAARG